MCLWSAEGAGSQHAVGQTPPRGQTDTCENITFANFGNNGKKSVELGICDTYLEMFISLITVSLCVLFILDFQHCNFR